jgi:tetratricopeptide (TPR) repeat protein
MRRCVIAILLLAGLMPVASAFEDELKFIEGLTAEGFPDLAHTVLQRTLSRFPAAESCATELRIRILIAGKNFDEAQTQIASVKDPAPLWIFLADTAYRARQFPAAEAAYKTCFETVSSADDTILQAAVNYGELLAERGDQKSARALYEKVLTFPDLGKSARPVKVKLAKLLVEENPERAKKLCEEVQLGGLDLWFGQAVVIWADVMIRNGEWSETQAVLETQLETLNAISGSVTSTEAPIAGARTLLGICYEHAGKKAEALHQLYNVYVQYGDSEWGPQAQERAQALKKQFEGQGKTVRIELGANCSKMEESAFRVARRLFFDKQYAEAVPAYIDALNKYPEGDEAMTALRELALSCIRLNDPRRAKTVAAYISERFASREEAADALLAAGKGALDEKQNALAAWIYDRYFASFPQHACAPSVLYSLAGLKTGSEQDADLSRILENYPDSPYAVRALGRLAWNAYEKEEYEIAARRFETLLLTETDSQKLTRARFALAESYRFSNDWKNALETFQTLETALNRTAENFGVSDETLKFNRPFIEKSLFYQGVCLAKLRETENAVQAFDRFIEQFQTSEFVPQAQLAKGSALMELKRYDEALIALSGFDENSDRKFFEPVLYYRGQAFLETARYEESIQCLETLLNNWPESAFFFEAKLVQGRAYVAGAQNADAVRVLSDILNFASDDLLLTRAGLELGRAQTDPAEKLASFQRVALLADPDQPEQAALIAEALFESLPLYRELDRPQDLLADSLRLINEFPMFGKRDEIHVLRNLAQRQLETQKVQNL